MQDHNKLDIAAKLFPSVSNNGNSSVFRVSVVLKEEVDERILQLSVNMIYERFSLFFLRLRKGFFWNYFDTNHIHFKVEEERHSPCENIVSYENKGYIIKVLYYKNRISVEAFHSITDGSGVIEFVKSLVYYYISIKHGQIDSENKVLLFDEKEKNDEDSFLKHFSKTPKGKKYKKEKISFRIKGKKYLRKGHSVITGVISTTKIRECSKKYGCTITALLSSVLITSIYEKLQKNSRSKRPIIISIPVNLRKVFDSKTLKNFFGVVNIEYKMGENTKFEEIVKSVSEQLKLSSNQEYLEKISAKNVKMSSNTFSSYTPLIFKNMIVPVGFNLMGELTKSITISNIGRIDFPSGVKPYIEHSEILLYPTKKSPINCSVCSFEDKLSISFIKSIRECEMIRDFFISLMKKTGSEVEIYSNEWGENFEK